MVKRIDAQQVEHIAVVLEAELDESDWLSLDKAFAVEAEHRRRVACKYLAAQTLN